MHFYLSRITATTGPVQYDLIDSLQLILTGLKKGHYADRCFVHLPTNFNCCCVIKF